jgi:agmatine/peptidylarginine deiminase
VLRVSDKKIELNELFEGSHVVGMDAKAVLKQDGFMHTVKE